MTPENEATFEPENQVLSDGFDALEAPSVQLLCDAGRGTARVRRLDLQRLADESLEPQRRSVESITFGHDVTLGCKAASATIVLRRDGMAGHGR
jgi:hypothetical protein